VKKLSPILVLLLLTACGGSSSDSTPIITVPPFTPAPSTPPVVTPPVAGPALFSAPQKIDGINITIPYTNVNGKYTFEHSIESFYVVGNHLSVLKSYFPSNVAAPDVYGEEFAYSLTNNSSTIFATKKSSVVSTSMPADTIEIADFNRDGYKDVFIGDAGYDAGNFGGGQNKLLFGNGSGGFIDKSTNIPTTKGFTHSTAIADIDNDGDVDIYVGNLAWKPTMTKPYFLVNDGRGIFTRLDDLFANGLDASKYSAAEFADLDADGVSELVLGGDKVDSIILRYNGGQYSATQTLSIPGRVVTDISIADLNGDAKREIVMSTTAEQPFYRGTTVYVFGQTNGVYGKTETFVISEQRWNSKLHVTDVNRDGLLDIVSTGYMPDTKILINDGKTFKVDETFRAPWDSTWSGVEMWDVNNDGRLDFLYTKQEQQIIPNTLNVSVHVLFG
jgi:hypothetical protein